MVNVELSTDECEAIKTLIIYHQKQFPIHGIIATLFMKIHKCLIEQSIKIEKDKVL